MHALSAHTPAAASASQRCASVTGDAPGAGINQTYISEQMHSRSGACSSADLMESLAFSVSPSLLHSRSGHAVWSCVCWCLGFFMERGRETGRREQSIGVSECNNRTYISSSLCPGQRVQRLHAVFSILSLHTHTHPPTPPLSLFLSLSFPTVLFLFHCGIPPSCTWTPLLRGMRCVCV